MSGFQNNEIERCIEHRKRGDVWIVQQNYSEAKLNYQTSLDIAEELVQKEPDNEMYQRNLSLSLEKMGDAYTKDQLLGEALKEYKRSLYFREILAEKNPDDARTQRDLWIAYWRVSDILEQTGSMDAIAYWHKTYSILNGIKKKGLSFTEEDEQYFIHLKEVFGKE